MNTENSKRTAADIAYKRLLKFISNHGQEVKTRNHKTRSSIECTPIIFDSTPLVTLRTTAWRLALLEMEWFMSGNSYCPKELEGWWRGQLDEDGAYVDGYPSQFRNSTYEDIFGSCEAFDQIEFILNGLTNNPNSRRLILTSWNPGEMASITETNGNPNTPTTCHNTCTQFFVRDGEVHLKTYQRSADMLLGVPHNWIQTWALLLYFAHHSNLAVGCMQWIFGDAHIYMEDSHLEAAKAIELAITPIQAVECLELVYAPEYGDKDSNGIPVFRAQDFSFKGKIPEPVTFVKPKLL